MPEKHNNPTAMPRQETAPSGRAEGRRVIQACTRCRAGKTRCDGRTPVCSACADRNRDCVYPATQKTRGPGKSKQRIEALEERLARMESMLRQEPSVDAASKSPQQLCPPRSEFLPFLRISDRLARWKREGRAAPLKRIVLSEISPEVSELWLVEQVLGDICAELPFLSMPWFLGEIRLPDANNRPDAWWQCMMNAVVASSICYKTVIGSFQDVAMYSWTFFRNAYAVLPELILHGHCISAAHAVMAMAMFMRLSADTRTTMLLLSTSIRMQHSLGPHTQAEGHDTPSSVLDETNDRLFWTTYVLDMEMSVNTGLPPAHTIKYSTATLPGSIYEDTVFRLRVKLAGIQSRIGSQCFTLEETDLAALVSELEAWVLQVPVDIRPNCGDGQPDGVPNEGPDIPVIMLHFVYHHCVSMVCWSLVRRVAFDTPGYLQIRGIVQDRADVYRRKARSSAGAVIRILSQFSVRSFTELWRALCYPVSASIALLAVICKEPTHPEARSDLSLLASLVHFLERMVRDEGCDLQRMLEGVAKFKSVATDAVRAATASEMPVNPALWPLALASGQTGKAIATSLTCSAYHPMYVAQSFMGNTPNRDRETAKQLAEILDIPWGKNGFGPFVPDSLMPATYGFAFCPEKSSNS